MIVSDLKKKIERGCDLDYLSTALYNFGYRVHSISKSNGNAMEIEEKDEDNYYNEEESELIVLNSYV